MSALRKTLQVAALLALGLIAGCESTDSGYSSASTSVYYGTAIYDPWYHGDYDHDHDVVVTPPPGTRPPGDVRPPGLDGSRPRPEHPIAYPPGERPPRPSTQPTPRPPSVSTRPSRPAPSIPSAPRVAPRGGRR